MLAKIAIIGRPNVGKSTLFNKIVGSRKALVKNEPGTTRDIKISDAIWCEKPFQIIDTGGLNKLNDPFSKEIENKITELLTNVNAVIVIVDGTSGYHMEDKNIVQLAKKSGHKTYFVINKVDSQKNEEKIKSEFYELHHTWLCTSFENKVGIADILDWIINEVIEKDEKPKTNKNIKTLTIIGKPNSGKSTLCNFINGYNRMIVTNIPGTTTDSVDSLVEYNEKKYKLIDTAGIRRKAQRDTGLEMLSSIQSEKSIARSDIVILMVDCMAKVGHQEARLVSNAAKIHKPIILVINKSDIGKNKMKEFRKTTRENIQNVFAFFKDIPIVFISAKTGSGVGVLFKTIENIWNKLHFQVTTSELNSFFSSITKNSPAFRGKTKLYYVVHTKQVPPTFIAFTNSTKPLEDRFKKFLVNQIKNKWSLTGIPIRIFTRKK